MTKKFGNKSFKANTSSNGGEGGTTVDWKALNEHIENVVQESTACEEGSPASVLGVISGIVELGNHQDPERIEPMEQSGDEAGNKWRKNMVEKGKATDEDGTFHYQAPPRPEVCFYVDFPNIIVDKGQFFGDSNPAPYRVLLGGEFNKVPAQPTKVEGYPNKNNTWVFNDKSRATSLAKAAGLKDLKDGFAQERLLELIGSTIQFSVEVFIDSKGFLKEKITKPTRPMAGIPPLEVNDDLLFFVGLEDEDNEATYLKMLTKPVKTYLEQASNFAESKLKWQLEALEGSPQGDKPSEGNASKKEETPKEEAPAKVKTHSVEDDEEFSDIPF